MQCKEWSLGVWRILKFGIQQDFINRVDKTWYYSGPDRSDYWVGEYPRGPQIHQQWNTLLLIYQACNLEHASFIFFIFVFVFVFFLFCSFLFTFWSYLLFLMDGCACSLLLCNHFVYKWHFFSKSKFGMFKYPMNF